MNRRNLISSLGLAAVSLPVLGRTAAAQMYGEHGPSEAARRHMHETAAVGSLSLLISRMALTKVQFPKLLQFAKFEVAEQETIADILKGMMMPPQDANGQVVPPTDQEAMSHLDPMGQQIYQKLQSLSGPEFAHAYINAEIEGHQKLLTIQETYLAAGHDRDELNVAKLAKGMIKEHLTLLGDIRSM